MNKAYFYRRVESDSRVRPVWTVFEYDHFYILQ